MYRHACWSLLILAASNIAAIADETPTPLELARSSVEYRIKSCSRGEVKLRVVREVGPQPSETLYDMKYDTKRVRVVRTARLLGSESWGAPVTQIVGTNSIIDDSSAATAVQVMPLNRHKDPKEGLTLIDPVPLGMVLGGASFLHKTQIDSLLLNVMTTSDVKVAAEDVKGERLWRVMKPGGPDKAEVTVWYAPSQGFGVTRIELKTNDGQQTVHETTETTLKQYPANAVWYPSVVRRTFTVGGTVKDRHFVHVDSATFGGESNEAAYTLAGMGLTPGRPITDSTSNRPLGYVWDGSKAVPSSEVAETPVPPPPPAASPFRRLALKGLAAVLLAAGVFWTLRVVRKKLRHATAAGGGQPPTGDARR